MASETALEMRLAERLIALGLTIATAESCTGGLVAHRITSVAGSSTYYLGGVVAYSNALKRSFLDVPDEILQGFGAVSEECARAMCQGARGRLGADVAVSTTGIAGPSGGTARKPVGLVYIGCATPWGTRVERHLYAGDRHGNIAASAESALALVLSMVDERGA